MKTYVYEQLRKKINIPHFSFKDHSNSQFLIKLSFFFLFNGKLNVHSIFFRCTLYIQMVMFDFTLMLSKQNKDNPTLSQRCMVLSFKRPKHCRIFPKDEKLNIDWLNSVMLPGRNFRSPLSRTFTIPRAEFHFLFCMMEVGRTPLRASSIHNNSEPGASSPSPAGHMGTQVPSLDFRTVGAKIASFKFGTLRRTVMITKFVCAKRQKPWRGSTLSKASRPVQRD